jgi:hypothetical protein
MACVSKGWCDWIETSDGEAASQFILHYLAHALCIARPQQVYYCSYHDPPMSIHEMNSDV